MIRMRQVKLPIYENDLIKKISKLLKINSKEIRSLKIIKKSLDARDKNNLMFVYEVDIDVNNEESILKKNKSKDLFIAPNEEYVFPIDKATSTKRPIIIGAGPAGLYCAYLLAEHGYKPLIIERGEQIEERIKTVEEFWNNSIFNKNSNIQFGEGGAGTFSDGKLNTSVKDRENRIKKVLEIFVENGAPKEILYEAKPHIGTDILRDAIKNMRNKIISLGGEFKFNTTLTNIIINNNKLKQIEINNNELLDCEILVLAIGHSARDTFKMLYDNKFEMSTKSFAIGVRIEHPQKMINKSQYGVEESKYLTPASYKLTHTTSKGRGVYSFCMCPGGYVVNASSEEKRLVVNGMSNYKRESTNANSALVVTVTPKDFGDNPLDGIEYQRMLEEKAYELGNGNIPVQKYIDYKENKTTTNLDEVTPCIKGKYTFTNLNDLFPEYINESLKEAIEVFGTKIEGYNRSDAILSGVESRTSSPVRIIRNDSLESSIEGVYPCGEGAGYAGGITTAAVDGIKVAEKIALKLK